ncbi:MAG TPA: hypothetical protein VNW92_20340, partial [Polyangiaceae bacterium]|nr:hypothetical protein [Polyangiaceae bacterium]
ACVDASSCHSGKVATCTAFGVCGQCSIDTDCDGSRPHCTAVTRQCRACLTRTDCTPDHPACTLDGQCAECADAADCTSGSCDTSQGQCQ